MAQERRGDTDIVLGHEQGDDDTEDQEEVINMEAIS